MGSRSHRKDRTNVEVVRGFKEIDEGDDIFVPLGNTLKDVDLVAHLQRQLGHLRCGGASGDMAASRVMLIRWLCKGRTMCSRPARNFLFNTLQA